MRKKSKRILCSIIAAVLLNPFVVSSSADEQLTDATVQSYEEQIAALQNKREKASSELEDVLESKAGAQAEIERLDELMNIDSQLKKLAEDNIESYDLQIEAKKQSIAETEAKIESQKEALLARMTANYMDDDTDLIELVLGAESLVDFLSKLDYVAAIFDYDSKVISSLKTDKEKLAEDTRMLNEAEEKQKSLVATYEKTILENGKIREQKEETMNAIVADEESLVAFISQNQSEQASLDAELKQYIIEEQARREAAAEAARKAAAEEAARKAAAEEAARRAAEEEAARKAAEEEAARQQAQQYQYQSDSWYTDSYSYYDDYNYSTWDDYSYDDPASSFYLDYSYSGENNWPLDIYASYSVSSEFGWRYLYGIKDFHYGIDLSCAAGTNVYAFASGTVIKAEYHWSYGNYVLIDHGGGISTRYAHMSECAVYEGQYVSAGQLVGHVGLTGTTTGYHLHFEVREDGNVVDPRGYLVFP